MGTAAIAGADICDGMVGVAAIWESIGEAGVICCVRHVSRRRICPAVAGIDAVI